MKYKICKDPMPMIPILPWLVYYNGYVIYEAPSWKNAMKFVEFHERFNRHY